MQAMAAAKISGFNISEFKSRIAAAQVSSNGPLWKSDG